VNTESNLRTVAFVGDYLPRKCGIATFTSDLLGAVAARHPQTRCFAVPVNDINGLYQYSDVVRFEIEEQDLDSYRRAAAFLNASDVDVVSVQHEFGIFGGPSGSHLLALLRHLRAPVVTTLHTVLVRPNADQQRVMLELIARSARLVVMTERGRKILQDVYHAPLSRIDLIPHGIPDVTFVAPDNYKEQFGVSGKKVLLTFGLLSPNKGIEHVLHALPEVVAEFPDVVYIVLGATHPNEVRTRGETYRSGLEDMARKNDLENHVIFNNRFVDLQELTRFIGAADLYITPYLDEAQITSGTLAYAFGAGKPVISTPYWHAAELLRDQRGVLVPFGDSSAISREVRALLRDENRRYAMSDNASSFESARRQGVPSAVAPVAARGFGSRPHESPESRLNHHYLMTSSTGNFHRARISTPNLFEDHGALDNARSLIVAVLRGQLKRASTPARARAATYAASLHDASNPKNEDVRRFFGFDGRGLDEQGSEGGSGLAVWAMRTASGHSPHWSKQVMSGQLFAQALSPLTALKSPRAWAFSLIGLDEYLRQMKDHRPAKNICEDLTGWLMTVFDKVARSGWDWFEDGLADDAAKPALALIVSGRAAGQTSTYEGVRPIGSNGYEHCSSARAGWRPIEAEARISALAEAYSAAADPWWYGPGVRRLGLVPGPERPRTGTLGSPDWWLPGLFAPGPDQREPGGGIDAYILAFVDAMPPLHNTGTGIQGMSPVTTSRRRSEDMVQVGLASPRSCPAYIDRIGEE
jgi:glycosyltransferase involved in cell wall biosynthesis